MRPVAADTWIHVEQLLLEAIRVAELAGEDVATAARDAVPHLREDLYSRTLWALYDDRFIEALADRDAELVMPTGLAPNGRRAVRQWPSGQLVDDFLAELERRIEAAPDEQEKSRLRRLVGTAGEVGKDILTEVLSAVAVRSAGLG